MHVMAAPQIIPIPPDFNVYVNPSHAEYKNVCAYFEDVCTADSESLPTLVPGGGGNSKHAQGSRWALILETPVFSAKIQRIKTTGPGKVRPWVHVVLELSGNPFGERLAE